MTTIHLTRRRAVAAALCAPVTGLPEQSRGAPTSLDPRNDGAVIFSDPLANLHTAYAAWREADDHATAVDMAVQDDLPRTPRFQVTFPTRELNAVLGREIRPKFLPLTRANLEMVSDVQPEILRNAKWRERTARNRRRLAAHESAVQTVKERHGLAEAEQRWDDAIGALIDELAQALCVDRHGVWDVVWAVASNRGYRKVYGIAPEVDAS